MLAATPLSAIMQAYGRRAGFWLACVCGAIGAMLAAYGLYAGRSLSSWQAACFRGSTCRPTGSTASPLPTGQPGISPQGDFLCHGGRAAVGHFGPQLVSGHADAMAVPFLATYLGVIGLNIAGMVLLSFLDIPTPAETRSRRAQTGPPGPRIADQPGHRRRHHLRHGGLCADEPCHDLDAAWRWSAAGSTPGDAANIVSAHVLAMYAPSFITGHVIARFGSRAVVAVGLVILALSGAVAISGGRAGAVLPRPDPAGHWLEFRLYRRDHHADIRHSVEERGRVQGLNDMIVFGGVFVPRSVPAR